MRLLESIRNVRVRDMYPFVIFALFAIALEVLPRIFSGTVELANLYDIGQTFANYGLISLALGLAMMAGEYDLSTAGTYALGAVVAVKVGSTSPAAGVFAALGIGVAAGLVQGLIAARLSMSAVPVTLGGYLTLFGLNHWIAHSKTVNLEDFSIGSTLDNPIASVFSIRSLICLGVFAFVRLLLRFTRIGPQVRAVGGDRRASRTAGVPAARILTGVLIASGLLSAIAGALTSYSLGSANPDVGLTPLIFGTIAALLGGVSLAGGRGTVAGILAGVLSYATLQEALAVIGTPDWASNLVTGALLLAVATLTAPHLKRELQAMRTRARSRLLTSGSEVSTADNPS